MNVSLGVYKSCKLRRVLRVMIMYAYTYT